MDSRFRGNDRPVFKEAISMKKALIVSICAIFFVFDVYTTDRRIYLGDDLGTIYPDRRVFENSCKALSPTSRCLFFGQELRSQASFQTPSTESSHFGIDCVAGVPRKFTLYFGHPSFVSLHFVWNDFANRSKRPAKPFFKSEKV